MSGRLPALAAQAEAEVSACFAAFARTAHENTRRVLAALAAQRVSDGHFGGTTGYGYDDAGRAALDAVYANLMGAEDALVRVQFVSGTHAMACALFAALRPGDTLVSATGLPYDTLHGVIGLRGTDMGSLRDYGVGFRSVALTPEGTPDWDALRQAVRNPAARAVLVQRSRGYEARRALSVEDIEALVRLVKAENPSSSVVVDNCYGEFTETREPCAVGADLVAGSLIKNPGGGLALTGGYVAGRHELVERAAARLTAPGIGRACGATLGQNRALFQGLFQAPHAVSQALMTAAFCAALMEKLGYETDPKPCAPRGDIIQMVRFGAPEPLLRFCRGVQAGAPVDSFAVPEPWAMPGYDCPVVMAAGTFVQGASLELSCDAPMRPPFDAYLQGGLTYEAGRAGVLTAAAALLEET
ncbi:MAG: methionine gamma-lyase family protein, partial [Oscillospiraceae bacterium]|nr:methionine gamma-lyase family protein [Oscillospiraceae bacterium]